MDESRPRSRAATLAARTAGFVAEATNPPPPRHRWLRRGRYDLVEIADAVLALFIFVTSNAPPSGQHTLIVFLTSVPLVFRTRWPLPAWTASALFMIACAVAVPDALARPGALIVYGLCLYAVMVRCVLRVVIAAAAVTVATAIVIDPRSPTAALFFAAIPLLAGVAVRTRRSGTRRLREQEIRHSGERALLVERQRIARELHDVVAHHMSVIAVQAEAAPYKTADPPPELVESFTEIRQSALTGLTELRRLLGVLRSAGGAATAPQPGLAELDTLLDSARGGGVSVTATVTGDPVPLPEGVDLSAYRILQEALSNAMRHSPGSRVRVRVDYRDDRLDLEIRNDAGVPGERDGSGGTGTGHGIIGMRERAAMLGGTLFAGPAEGGFRVQASLPIAEENPA